MSFFSARFICSNEECLNEWEDLIRRSEKDSEHPCPNCNTACLRQFEVGNHTKASYVDGNGRFKDAKEASKLNREMAGMSHSDSRRKEIAAEIKKTKFVFSKDKV